MRRKRQARMWQQISKESRKAANRVAQACREIATESGVQPDVSRTGRVVLRCDEHGKVCYRDETAAAQAVEKIPDPMVAYLAKCGFWHLATRR